MLIVKIISALIAFVMSVLPLGNTPTERKCNPEFNGTFLQSWMSGSWDDDRWQTEIENMKEAGIEYLILQDVANKGSEALGGEWNVYYDSELPVFEDAAFGGNVIEAALRNCEGSGIKVFIGLAMLRARSMAASRVGTILFLPRMIYTFFGPNSVAATRLPVLSMLR